MPGPRRGQRRGLRAAAIDTAQALGAGHTFVLYLRNAYPINVLNRIKDCPEVCRIFCATANPLQAVVAESEQGRGIVGVIDGSSPKGVEQDADRRMARRVPAARSDTSKTLGLLTIASRGRKSSRGLTGRPSSLDPRFADCP